MTEFGFIDSIRRLFAELPDNGFEGIGDDCAVLPLGDGTSLLFTADLLTEGVHFLRAATSARELGRKSLAVNLSDIAAMGARPVATLLSLALPADAEDAWTAEFTEGYRELSARYGAALVGGDTTRSAGGITINVTAIGRAAPTHTSNAATPPGRATSSSSRANWEPRVPDCGTSSPDGTTRRSPPCTATRSRRSGRVHGWAPEARCTP